MGTEPIEIVWPQPSIPPEGSEMNEEEVILAEGRWVRLVRRGTWEYLERRGRGDAAVLVPITAGGELILVEQLRKPFLRRTIELPAGLGSCTARTGGGNRIRRGNDGLGGIGPGVARPHDRVRAFLRRAEFDKAKRRWGSARGRHHRPCCWFGGCARVARSKGG